MCLQRNNAPKHLKLEKMVVARFSVMEVVYMTIGNSAFCLALYLTGVYFRGELQHGGHADEQKIKCRPIRTREIAGARL